MTTAKKATTTRAKKTVTTRKKATPAPSIPDLPNNPFIYEVLDVISKQRSKAKKIEALKKYEAPVLKALFIWNFDESVISAPLRAMFLMQHLIKKVDLVALCLKRLQMLLIKWKNLILVLLVLTIKVRPPFVPSSVSFITLSRVVMIR